MRRLRPAGLRAALSGWTGVGLAVATVLSVVAAVTVSDVSGERPVGRVHAVATSDRSDLARSEMAQILGQERSKGFAPRLPRATAPPVPAPASVADQSPLRPHEVFGFAPYWSLGRTATIDVSELTTIAYFALGVNPDGSLQESGPGWAGYESQAFADLVTRAHTAGDRVVLTVNCFTQAALDRLTSSPASAETLATQVVAAIAAEHLDGVNLDLEGEGSSDQRGLTSLVATVSRTVHAADPHYQVTMDTYASSAGDPRGFYDIGALAPEVDGFFVMAYDLNLASAPDAASPITSLELCDEEAAAQYAAVVAPAKVILGTSWYGEDWPTTNGTMAALPMGPPTPLSDAQVLASGEPVYWDDVTDTAWTSYEVAGQWYETYFESSVSVYMVTELARRDGLGGVGAWALGMDGGDSQMMAALDGVRPTVGVGPPGPLRTTGSRSPGRVPVRVAEAAVAAADGASGHGLPGFPSRAGTVPAGGDAAGAGGAGSSGASGSPSTGPATTGSAVSGGGGPPGSSPPGPTVPVTLSPPTTSAPPPGPQSGAYRYSGTWHGQAVALTRTTGQPAGVGVLAGTVTGFATTDPTLACLSSSPPLDVWLYPGATTYFVTASRPTDCADAVFTFPAVGVP